MATVVCKCVFKVGTKVKINPSLFHFEHLLCKYVLIHRISHSIPTCHLGSSAFKGSWVLNIQRILGTRLSFVQYVKCFYNKLLSYCGDNSVLHMSLKKEYWEFYKRQGARSSLNFLLNGGAISAYFHFLLQTTHLFLKGVYCPTWATFQGDHWAGEERAKLASSVPVMEMSSISKKFSLNLTQDLFHLLPILNLHLDSSQR